MRNTFISAGQLRYRIGIYTVPTVTSDSGAEIPQEPLLFCKAWAKIETAGGSEPFGGGKDYSQLLHSITTHYRSDKRILPTMQVKGESAPYKDRIFQILAVEDSVPGAGWVTLRCRELGTSATP